MLRDVERRIYRENKALRIGIYQFLCAIGAGLCLGDTWAHSFGIFFIVWAISPVVDGD